MGLSTDTKMIIGGGVVLLIAGLYASKKLVDVASDALPYINPADSNNLVNQGVTSIGSWLTDNPNWTLGGSIYDVTHDGTFNPVSSNNIVNKGVSGVGGWVTGNKDWTLGGQIYDWFH